MFKSNKSVITSMLSASVISSLLMTGCAHTATSTVPAASTIEDSRPVVALVLGGGGAKGFAHVGVIKTLEANGIKPDLIVGTSSGSIIGSLYASGLTASQLEKVALDINNSDLTDLTLAHQGIIKGEKLRQFVNRQVRGQSIEDFPIRFAAVAAEQHTLKKAVFNKGEAGIAVQASSSIPKVFIPPRIADPNSNNQVGKKYIDGGVVSIVPVDAAKDLGADVVIAVDLQAETASKTNDGSPKNAIVSTEFSSLDASVLESTNLFNSPVINQVISDASALLNESGFLKQGRLLDEDDFWSLIEQGYARYNQADSQAPQSLAQQQRYANKLAEIERADVIIRPDVADISAIGSRKKADAIAAGTFAAEQNLDAIKAAIKKAETNYRFALKQ